MKGIRIRRGVCALSVLAGAVLIGSVGGTAAWLLFWAVLTVPLLSLAYRVALRFGFRAVLRVQEESVLRGERVRCALVLINSGFLPVPEVRVRLLSGKIECDGEEIVCALAPGESREIPFSPLCRHCGPSPVGAEAAAGDLLGLFERRIRVQETVNVLPRRQRIRNLLAAPPRETERPAATRPYLGERVPDGQLRPYVIGDDVRRIHWKASALQGRPVVRNLMSEPKREVYLLPDARAALPESERGWLAADSVLEGTLCVADYYLRRGVPIRVIPDAERAMDIRSGADYPRLYRACTEDFFSGKVRPDELLEQCVAENGTASGCIILTWELDEAFLRRVERCVGLGAAVSVVYAGDPAAAGVQAAAARRLPVFSVTEKRDVFTVLGGAAGEGGAT